jgi:hypothetical protein
MDYDATAQAYLKMFESEHKVAYVHVEQISKPHSDDRGIAGVYGVHLHHDTPENLIANAALDGFHEHMGIKNLDSFNITVRSGHEKNSPIIPEDDQHGSYENGHFYHSLEKVR